MTHRRRIAFAAPRFVRSLSIAAVVAWPVAAQGTQAPTVTVSGVGFASYGYSVRTDSSLAVPAHDNNFDVSRSYLNVLGKFSDGVSSRVTVDMDNRTAASNQLTIRLKYAFVAWQPGAKGPLTVRFGLTQTPWIDFEEALWDYRMQGPVAIDRNKILSPSDFGAAIDGSWHGDAFNAQAGVYNGEGYNAAPGDQGKDAEVRASIRLMKSDLPGRVGGLRVSGFAQLGRQTGGGARRRFLGMLSWKSKQVALAGEIEVGQDSTAPASPRQKHQLVTLFGTYNLPRTRAALIARYDRLDPNTDAISTLNNSAGNLAVNPQNRLIAGISYVVSPNLRVLLDADLNAVDHGATNVFDKNREMVFFHTEFRF